MLADEGNGNGELLNELFSSKEESGEDGSVSDDLTNSSHYCKSKGETDTHTDTVKGGIDGVVLVGEHFRTTEDDTVNYDQRKEYAE